MMGRVRFRDRVRSTMLIQERVLVGKIMATLYVTLMHKTSHKGTFFNIEIYALSES